MFDKTDKMISEMKVGEPVPESFMDQENKINTICETLRQIYHLTDNEEIKLKCRVAMTMAKKMAFKLSAYKWDWEKGIHFE